MTGKILVGTASWSDPGFVADWYPKKLPASERLPYYAAHFNFVELNSSFYGVPAKRQVERWCQQTPKDFVFDVKLHKLLSRHSAEPANLPPDLRKQAQITAKNKIELTPQIEEAVTNRLLEEIAPFRQSGKLGALLLQLSPAFSPRSHRLESLDSLLALLADYPVAVELRNRGWVSDSVLPLVDDYFRKHRLSFVVVDAPETQHFMAMPFLSRVTTPDLAYMRLHGRNEQGYITGRTVAERFNYLYSDEELTGIAEKVKKLAEQAKETHVVYNNNASDYAIRSARRFREMIEGIPPVREPVQEGLALDDHPK